MGTFGGKKISAIKIVFFIIFFAKSTGISEMIYYRGGYGVPRLDGGPLGGHVVDSLGVLNGDTWLSLSSQNRMNIVFGSLPTSRGFEKGDVVERGRCYPGFRRCPLARGTPRFKWCEFLQRKVNVNDLGKSPSKGTTSMLVACLFGKTAI